VDSMTHLYFAANLLTVAGRSHEAIACSLFPQIDRTPAYYHRLYAHSIDKAAAVIAASRVAYWADSEQVDNSNYFESRLREDRARIQRYVAAAPFKWSSARIPDDLEMRLSFISHLYNDKFNNPIQAFVPFNVYPSGAWNLWSSIDSAEFRWYLYDRATIDDFRAEVFSGGEWQARLSAQALIAAMITGLANACPVRIEIHSLRAAMRSVGVEELLGTAQLAEAEELLTEHDQRVTRSIAKFSEPNDFTHGRFWAGHGY
jgi:hypothetical protein